MSIALQFDTMAEINLNNPIITLNPTNIKITWNHIALVNRSAQVKVLGYKDQWKWPHLKEVLFDK